MLNIDVTSVIVSFLEPIDTKITMLISTTFFEASTSECYWKTKLNNFPKDKKYNYFVYNIEKNGDPFEKELLKYRLKLKNFSNWHEITKEERIEMFKIYCKYYPKELLEHQAKIEDFTISHELLHHATNFVYFYLEKNEYHQHIGATFGIKHKLEYRIYGWKVVKTKDKRRVSRGLLVDAVIEGVGVVLDGINKIEKLSE
eukprot:gene3587-6322_t